MMTRRAWNFSQSMYRSTAIEGQGLGLSHTDGADSREDNKLYLGPKINDIDLSSVGGTAANVNSGGIIQRTSGGTEYFYYVNRGTVPAKLVWSTLALASTQPSALSERGTSVIVTKAPGGTAEITFGMAATNYETVTAVAATGAADTRASGGDMFRVFGQGPDRIYGLDGQTIQGNVLSASVDMSTPSFASIATFAANDITPTGFAMLEDRVMWGTNKGPLLLYSQFEEFGFAGGQVPANSLNCHAMRFVPYLGVLVPLDGQLRLHRSVEDESHRVGPEAYNSPSTVVGFVTGMGFDAHWVYMALRNNATSTTYLLAARPRQPGDWHYLPLSFYCLGSFSSACEWVDVPSDAGGERTNPTMILGKGSNAAYVTLPISQRPSEDTNYRYQDSTTQTAYGTEIQPPRPVTIKRIIVPRVTATATATVTLSVAYTDHRGNSTTKTFAAMNTPGYHVFEGLVTQELQGLVSYQPRLALYNTASTSTPMVMGPESVIVEDEYA